MTQKTNASLKDAMLSIGDLADATGIAVETLRIWERRYGKPASIRLPSGHRRYNEEHVRWVRRVAEALSRGHRPGQVIRMEDKDIDGLLGPKIPSNDPNFDRMLGLVRSFDVDGLRAALSTEMADPRHFIRDVVGPLAVAVGRAWADGQLDVRHEHLLSDILEELLRDLRRKLPLKPDAARILLTTLPGERHLLGVHLAAVAVHLGGAESRILGAETPVSEIVAAAKEARVLGVAISVSLATGGVQTDTTLAELRKDLPQSIHLVIGGAGARGVRRGPRGVEYIGDLAGMESWVMDSIKRGFAA